MSDLESDFHDYENTKSDEGGLHPGRTDPSRQLVMVAAIVVVLLILGGIALALIP